MMGLAVSFTLTVLLLSTALASPDWGEAACGTALLLAIVVCAWFIRRKP